MKEILVIFALICVSLAVVDDAKWEEYKTKHKKSYKDAKEESHRRGIYEDNVKIIEAHNQKFNKGEVSWSMAENMYTDMTADEVMQNHTGLSIDDYTNNLVKSGQNSVKDKNNTSGASGYKLTSVTIISTTVAIVFTRFCL